MGNGQYSNLCRRPSRKAMRSAESLNQCVVPLTIGVAIESVSAAAGHGLHAGDGATCRRPDAARPQPPTRRLGSSCRRSQPTAAVRRGPSLEAATRRSATGRPGRCCVAPSRQPPLPSRLPRGRRLAGSPPPHRTPHAAPAAARR
uniref:Uncharacterized protein n=1 Tax=Oryza meridionalis TaxID=40149 RepID=A0A0E0E3D1_9ORYZ